MKLRIIVPLLIILTASPAHAEKLTFDYRIYPPLQAVIDGGRSEMLRYDDSNPKYVTDRITTQGTSVDNWTEALDIIVRLRGAKLKAPADWADEIQQAWRGRCASEFITVAQAANSLTFIRRSEGCPSGSAQTGLYRIVAGRKSLFLLNAFAIGDMAEPARRQWLELLGSAYLAP